jgi:hypothetical protein
MQVKRLDGRYVTCLAPTEGILLEVWRCDVLGQRLLLKLLRDTSLDHVLNIL